MAASVSEDNARILVVLHHQEVLRDIAGARNPSSRNIVEYVTCPQEALAMIQQSPFDVVVTGQRFFSRKIPLSEIGTLLEAHFQGDKFYNQHFPPPVSGPADGVEFSEEIYKISSGTLVFRYSLLPSHKIGRIVADIPRIIGNNQSLADLLDFDDLAEVISECDWKRLRAEFPRFTYYGTLRKDHKKY